MLLWLCEITARLPGSPSITVLRAASNPGYNHPSAPGYYPPLLKQPGLLKRRISLDGGIVSASENAYGELVLSNVDGRFDDWLEYGYGDTARLLLGDSQDDYGNFVTVLLGTVEQPDGDATALRFRFRDRSRELDMPASPSVYAGNNYESPSTGLEGTPQDIKGRNKLRLWGVRLNVALDALDTAYNLFGANHDKNGQTAPVAEFIAPDSGSPTSGIRVNGAPWYPGSDFADDASLNASSTAQGDYNTALAQGLAMLGGTIGQGQVTADVTVDAGSPDTGNRVAGIIEALLLDAGVSAGDISGAAGLDAAAPYTAGAEARGETYRQVIDTVRPGALAYVIPNRLGVYQIKQVAEPSGTPAAIFRRFDPPNVAKSGEFAIKKLERQPSDTPVWRVTVNYAPLSAVQNADSLAASIGEAAKARYSSEYLSVTAEDASVLTQFPLAETVTIATTLIHQADAQALAEGWLALLGALRSKYRLVAQYKADLAAAIDLGDVVQVYFPRFGLDAGKLFNIHGIQYDARKFEVELELWG